MIQEDLLFKAGLSPKLVENSNSVFGVSINLNEIDGSTKSIEDYRFELEKLEASLKQLEKAIHDLSATLENELERIQRGNLPKIKELKEKLRQSEYHRDQMERRKEVTGLEIQDLENKAAQEKKTALETMQAEIDAAVSLKQDAYMELGSCKAKLKRNKELKQREKTRRINDLQEQNKTGLAELDLQITDKRKEIESQIATLTSERNDELHTKGADTERLSRIEEAIILVKAELEFIDKEGELKTNIDKFLSYFSEGNIFKFPSKILGTVEYLKWAEELNDFIEESKIDQFEKRSNERFASIISAVGKETTLLISKTGEIKKIINKINSDFRQKNFVSAVSNIELDITDSKNTSVMILKRIKEFNDEHAMNLGAANLFSGDDHDRTNEKAVGLLKHLVKETTTTKDKTIKLADSFELSFRVEENGNDTGWVEKLSSVGSEGTDVLVKAMINIMLLNVFKEGASRKFRDFKLHCMMDEIGKLHPNNVKGILKFANDRNILLINGSPTESTPLNYRHIYKIHKDTNRQSRIKRIISNNIMNEY